MNKRGRPRCEPLLKSRRCTPGSAPPLVSRAISGSLFHPGRLHIPVLFCFAEERAEGRPGIRGSIVTTEAAHASIATKVSKAESEKTAKTGGNSRMIESVTVKGRSRCSEFKREHIHIVQIHLFGENQLAALTAGIVPILVNPLVSEVFTATEVHFFKTYTSADLSALNEMIFPCCITQT